MKYEPNLSPAATSGSVDECQKNLQKQKPKVARILFSSFLKCELTLTAYQVFISGATSSNATLSHLLWTTLALLYSVKVQVTPKLEPHVVDECMSLSTGLEFLSNHFNQAYLAVNASLLTQPFSNKYKKTFIYKTSEIVVCTESILQAKHEMHNNAL